MKLDGGESGRHLGIPFGGRSGEPPESVQGVPERPAAHDRKVSQDDERCEDEEPAERNPTNATELSKGADGRKTAPAPDRELRRHNRHTDEKRHENVQQNEGGTASFGRLVGKPPHVPEPDRAPRCREHEAKPCTKELPILLHVPPYWVHERPSRNKCGVNEDVSRRSAEVRSRY